MPIQSAFGFRDVLSRFDFVIAVLPKKYFLSLSLLVSHLSKTGLHTLAASLLYQFFFFFISRSGFSTGG